MGEPAAVATVPVTANLRRDFADRNALIAYLSDAFPGAAERDSHVAPVRGGRVAAEERLARIRPRGYAQTRNETSGDVTRLSAYIRHGVLTLTEVRTAAIDRVNRRGDVRKFIQELAWRDYYQRLYTENGDDIVWESWEDWKTGYGPDDYADTLPDDIRVGATGLPCMDAFVANLYETGYLHNHARMWLAAYVVHWRRVDWRPGAAWFLAHLIDGDPASNNLSWQWVASTFGVKPYIFNRENLERHTDGQYCRTCPLLGRCDFEGNYDELRRELFRPFPWSSGLASGTRVDGGRPGSHR